MGEFEHLQKRGDNEMLKLKYLGIDDWHRPTYEDENGKLFKDLNLGDEPIDLCTVSGGYDGEPDTPIRYIKRYKDLKVEITGQDQTSKEDKFNYMMLDRLKQDCEYYLGNGNRYKNHLWAQDEAEQIKEMKKIYNQFADDKKPEWITLQDIADYESKMI